jgi:hypothetical protein
MARRLKHGLVPLVCLASIAAFSAPTAFASSGGTSRPFKAFGSGTGTTVLGDPVRFVVDGTSNNTHLGRATFHTEGVCLDPNCETSSVTITIVAANGDVLTEAGSATEGTFTGGTGRFAGATGQVTTAAVATPDPSDPLRFRITFTQTGTISY